MGIVKGIVFVIVGLAVGSAVNMGLVIAGSSIIPAPAGVDVSDAESIAESIHLFETKHFIFPFLAHALGTFCGVLATGFLGRDNRTLLVWIVAAIFFLGGIAAVMMIPAPVMFSAIDLAFAYGPMALLALWVLRASSQPPVAAA